MNGLNFSYPYIAFTALLILITVVERTWKNDPGIKQLSRIYCILIYLVFIGLRGHIGTDWYNYTKIFYNIPTVFSDEWPYFYAENRLEIGFIGFASALKTLWNNYYFFVFINTCMDLIIVHIFLKRYVDWYTLGFLIFFVMGGLTLCELMRNVRGIGFFILSIRYLQIRKPTPYFILNGLGLLFHWTSIFYLPLYWILHRRWPKTVFVCVFITGNILFLCQIEYLLPAIEWVAGKFGGRTAYLFTQYALSDYFIQRNTPSIGYIERVLTSVFIIALWRKLLYKKQGEMPVFINSYTLYLFSYLFLSEIKVLSARASLLFIFTYWALYPAFLEALQSRFQKKYATMILYIYCILKINGLTSIQLYRYDNQLWGIESYERRVKAFDHYYLNHEKY